MSHVSAIGFCCFRHFKSSVGWFSGETPNMEEFVHTGEEDDDAFAVFLRG